MSKQIEAVESLLAEYDMINSAFAKDLREALAERPAQQEHITDGSPCWCNPDLDYKDPDTGAEVWIHKEPQ